MKMLFYLLAFTQLALADGSAGKNLAEKKCLTCHGVDGQSKIPSVPKLAGQLAAFTELQLQNYRSGERHHPGMMAIAKQLTDKDIKELAAFYASRPVMKPDPNKPAPVLVAAGKEVYHRGKFGVTACMHCHGLRGEGLAPLIPHLAGQHEMFLYESMLPYQKKKDFKNPYAQVMRAIVLGLSEAELKAVAAYLSQLNEE